MDTLKLADNLYYLGIIDHDLRIFDIIMETKYGTTYNSYFLAGSEKTAIFETVKEAFFDEYIERLSRLTDVSKISYIIVNHTEPDHSGSIEKLLNICPNIKVVGTTAAIAFLKSIVNRNFDAIAVKDGESLSLGNKTLKFFSLPFLHWPDTMYTYLEEEGVLFTCDSFGAHYAHDGILRSTVKNENEYMGAMKYYFDNIIGPFKIPHMINALEAVKPLKIHMICNGHGPVLNCKIEETLNIYENWCKIEKNSKTTVVIAYVSAYGYTKMIAEKVSEGIKSGRDIDVKLYDLTECDKNTVTSEIIKSDGFLLGSPTILNDALKPIWDITTGLFVPMISGKPASAFGSFGWSGEAVPNLIERLAQLKLKVHEGLKIRFKPDENQLKQAFDFGDSFAKTL